MPLTIVPCDLEDGPIVVNIQYSTITNFMKLQNGSASIEAIRNTMTTVHSGVLSDIQSGQSDRVYLKVVDHEDDNVAADTMIAWADWIMPKDPNAPVSTGSHKASWPRNLNIMFCIMANRACEKMRTEVLKGRKSYVLHQIATLPEHQRRGAGTMLLTWAFERADKEGAVCYLDTEMDGKVIALYEKVGYVKVDQIEIPLGFGFSSGVYTHVAMVREPKTVAEHNES